MRGERATAVALAVLLALTGCALATLRGPERSEPQDVRCDGWSPVEDDLSAAVADYVKYVPLDSDPDGAVTKFGGQPGWLEDAEWPIDADTGEPMQFIGQVALHDDQFAGAEGKMAYIFGRDLFSGDLDRIDWESDTGVGVVIVQPGGQSAVPTIEQLTGPTVRTYDPATQTKVEIVYGVEAERRTDGPFIAAETLWKLPESERQDIVEAQIGDKIGGTPAFLQGDDFPGCGTLTTLLWQVEIPPFELNLGDGGVGFAFIDAGATTGRYGIQSH